MKIVTTGACDCKGAVLTPRLPAVSHEVATVNVMWFVCSLKPHPKLTIMRDDVRNLDEINRDGVDTIVRFSSAAIDRSGDLDLGPLEESVAFQVCDWKKAATEKGYRAVLTGKRPGEVGGRA